MNARTRHDSEDDLPTIPRAVRPRGREADTGGDTQGAGEWRGEAIREAGRFARLGRPELVLVFLVCGLGALILIGGGLFVAHFVHTVEPARQAAMLAHETRLMEQFKEIQRAYLDDKAAMERRFLADRENNEAQHSRELSKLADTFERAVTKFESTASRTEQFLERVALRQQPKPEPSQ